jgi:hypothetical protein
MLHELIICHKSDLYITPWILFEKELGKRIQNIIAKLEIQDVGQNYFKKVCQIFINYFFITKVDFEK